MNSEKPKFPLNLRENVKSFLRDKVFQSLKKIDETDRDINLFMMIVDDHTSQILNSFIQYII